MEYIIITAALVIALFCLYYGEMRANERRISRGEPPKKHHDITDHETNVYFLIGGKK